MAKVNRKELLTALTTVKSGLSNDKNVAEHFSMYVFKPGQVSTYNDSISARASINLDIDAAVPAKEFLELINKSSSDEIIIEDVDGELLVKSGRSKAGIRVLKDTNLPLEDLDITDWSSLPTDFIKHLDFVAKTSGKDVLVPEFTCVKISGDTMISCDGFRLTKYVLPELNFVETVLLPASYVSSLKNFAPIAFNTSDGWIHFKNKDYAIFSCRLGIGEYPNLQPFFEASGSEIQLPQELESALTRVQVFLDGKDMSDSMAEFLVSTGEITVKSRNNSGWIEETIDADYKGTPLNFQVNPEFFQSVLPIVKKAILAKNPALPDTTGIVQFHGENFTHCFTTFIVVPEIDTKDTRVTKKKKGE